MPDASSQPFTRAEVRVILGVADGMNYRRRDRSEDNLFFGRLHRVFLTFGPHPSVLASWGSDTNLSVRPTERGDRMYFTWRRPKEQATRHDISIEVPQAYRNWLPGFLDEPKPISPETYWRLFKLTEQEMQATTQYRFPLNPRRSRHTCARELHELGFSETDVQAAIGVSPVVMRRYVVSTPEQRGEKAEAAGWGSWT